MKARWLVEIAVTSFGVLAVAACATGTTPFGGGGGEGGESEWQGASSSASSSSVSSGGGAGGGAASSSSNGGPGSSSSSSSSSAASSSGACAESPCKLVQPQCGCAAGEACAIDGSSQGTRVCIPAGNTPIGGACTGDECVPGSLCVNTASGISTCMKYCSTDSNCTAPGGLCLITLNDGSSGQIPGVTLCTENCDPSTNVGCPVAGTACGLAQESMGQMRLLTRCSATGFGTQGASCTTDADCAATFGCFNAGTTQCLKYCKVGGAACPGGLTCSSLGMIGNTTYGACL